jgi:nitroimidazol reductase NimA-like FMN-containing flavoprotein (pyridoxamine 5'-phosphate oxidase superfamily)
LWTCRLDRDTSPKELLMSSPTEDSRDTAPFREIPREECERLLSQHTVGRVAWNAPDGPQLLPVNYAYNNKTIVFRTVPDGVMSQLERRTNVAFEIDGVDEDARTGWSVVIRGTAERVMQNFDLVELWTKAGPVPWAPGPRTVHIAITPRSIGGRAVVAS